MCSNDIVLAVLYLAPDKEFLLMKIKVDMDGVLVDFVGGIIRAFPEKDWAQWNHQDMMIGDFIGRGSFYRKIEGMGMDFWLGLEPFPWTKDLWNLCGQYGEHRYILTSPTNDPNCLAGKLSSMYKLFGKGFRHYVITDFKELCAGPNTILIDDTDKKLSRFAAAGGAIFKWPSCRLLLKDEQLVKETLANLEEVLNGLHRKS